MKMPPQNILVTSALLLVLIAGGIYFIHTPTAQEAASTRITNLKCPEEYKTTDEKANAFATFAEDYVVVNPKAYGNEDVYSAGRIDFLISHHCTPTLVNLGYDGVSQIDAKIRQELITAYMGNSNP